MSTNLDNIIASLFLLALLLDLVGLLLLARPEGPGGQLDQGSNNLVYDDFLFACYLPPRFIHNTFSVTILSVILVYAEKSGFVAKVTHSLLFPPDKTKGLASVLHRQQTLLTAYIMSCSNFLGILQQQNNPRVREALDRPKSKFLLYQEWASSQRIAQCAIEAEPTGQTSSLNRTLGLWAETPPRSSV